VINQFGLSAFTLKNSRYVAKTFNFNIYPRTFQNINKVFTCEAGSLEYLAQHNFDFNKMIYKGIPFLPLQEQEQLLTVCAPVRHAGFVVLHVQATAGQILRVLGKQPRRVGGCTCVGFLQTRCCTDGWEGQVTGGVIRAQDVHRITFVARLPAPTMLPRCGAETRRRARLPRPQALHR
jgi:hypothetical protein